MRTLWQDTRYGLRMLARSPGFTAIVVIVLAVGIGANTAVFSVVNAVMLRPLPYKDSQRIVIIQEQGIPWKEGFRYRPNFFWLREHNSVFESLAGGCGRVTYVTGIEKPRETWVCDVTWNLFPMLGVRPLLGRGFLPEDEEPQSTRVVVLSHAFWKDHFGGSSEAIGKSIGLTRSRLKLDDTTALNHETHTIVGVTPPGFDFPFGRSVPFWTPMVFAKEPRDLYPMPITSRARLKKGVTLEKASAELTVLASRLRNIDSAVPTDGGIIRIRRLLDAVVEGHRKLPLLLLGAAGFVLLIACGNAASLFLARAAVRQRETAVRVALGASRSRVLRQMLTESLLLSLAAGVVGLALTFCTVKGLVRMCPSDIPRLQETSVDLSVLGFTLGTSVLTSLLFGMMPARRASDIRVSEALKEATERTTSGRVWRRLHDGLVVSQLALSLVLLIGAALLIRSLIAVQKMDLGFRPQNVLAVEIRLPEAKYPEPEHCTAFFDALLQQVRDLPHVRSAALALHHLQLGATDWDITVSVPDHPPASPEEIPRAKRQFVTPGYFETMGIRLLRGRPLTDEDGAYTVLADENLVRKLFPNTDPIGQTLIHDNGELVMTIVGVTSTTRDFQTTDPADGALYWRLDRSYQNMILVARGDGDPLQLARAVRAQVASLEKDEVIHKIEPLETMLSAMLAPRRFSMVLLGLFAGIALLVATIGVCGLLQYATTQQTHDIAIRMALGARRVDVLRMVLGQGLRLVLSGVAVGLAGAVALTRVLSSLLYDVTPTDLTTLICVSLVLTGVALAASYLPARRAAKTDPMMALRYE